MDLVRVLRLENDTGIIGSGYLISHASVAVPYFTLLCIATISGTLGNILIIGAVISNKYLRTPGNVFILNLAFADLCVSSIVDPFNILSVIEGEVFFLERPGLCDVVASVCLTACYCSLYSIGAISFNRYIHIVHYEKYEDIFTLRNGVLICVGLWIVSFLLELPNITGWNGHSYDRKTLTCLWDRNYNYQYNIFFTGVGVGIPLVVISVCYFLIFWSVNRSKKRVATNGDNGSGKRDSMRLARTLFIIFIVFALCWLPFTLFVVIDPKDEFAQELYMFAILIAHVNSSLNCILYGITNKQFRKGYYKVLGMEKCMNEREARKAAGDSTAVHTTA